jgi:hypothetical protein
MGSLLDSILGNFNSGQIGGPPDGMIANARSSGYLPEDQVSTPSTDPYGNPVGGPAPGVPLPRPRPPEAGPPAFSPAASSSPGVTSPGLTSPAPPLDLQSDASGATGSGGLAAALGLNPVAMRRISAGLAGGLSNVKNSPFAGQVAANAAGGAFEAMRPLSTRRSSCNRSCRKPRSSTRRSGGPHRPIAQARWRRPVPPWCAIRASARPSSTVWINSVSHSSDGLL